MTLALILLAVGMLVLAGSVFVLNRDVSALKRAQAAHVWLQLQQQWGDPKLAQAVRTVQTLGESEHTNGHRPDDHHAVLMNGHLDAVQVTNHYFTNVGTLVRSGVVNGHQVFTLMGPTLSEVWHASRSYRDLLRDKQMMSHEDFDWLYTEWLNREYAHRAVPVSE